jgi:hypothetical protein
VGIRFAVLVLSVGAILGRAADCSSGNEAPSQQDAAVPDGDIVGCQTDPRDDTYAPNLTKQGQSGNFQFVLVSANPEPPAIDGNTWVVKLLDASGSPVPGATFTSIKPWMPDHGHGSSAVPGAADNHDGTYTIQPLYFFMAGLWQVTFAVQANGKSDSAVFSFCVQG